MITEPPGLIKLNKEGVAMTVQQNCGPFGIWIEQDTQIRCVDELSNQDKLEKWRNWIRNLSVP